MEQASVRDPWIGEATDAVEYFEAVQAAFEGATRAAGGAGERSYTIAGHHVRLRFAGPALIPRITPALAHLTTAPSPAPALSICLWDSASTGILVPPPPWHPDDVQAQGEVRTYNTARVQTVFDASTSTLSMLDAAVSVGLFWIRDARDLPYWETGAPLRAILHWWMGARGCHLTHAAAVGTGRGGVLLAGKGGSGKSTTALACLEAGMAYAGDDYCLLSADRRPYVHSLYSSGKVNPDNAGRFPGLRPVLSNADRLASQKALFFLHQWLPRQVVTGMPVRALFLPRVTGRPVTRLIPASPAAGLLALAPSSIFQLPGRRAATFKAVAWLTRQVPCYTLELGTQLTGVAHVIARFLDER